MNKKYYRLHTNYFDDDVYLIRCQYFYGNNLAIKIMTKNDEPFADLTVNIDELKSDDLAYVDTNNCPWAKEFIEDNKIGVYAGKDGHSGYCEYPLYRFNLDKLDIVRI